MSERQPGPRKRSNRRQVNLTLSEETAERLADAATERGVSQSYLASSLIAEGLDRLVPAAEIRWTS